MSHMHKKTTKHQTRVAAATLVLFTLFLSSCGFALRGDYLLSPQLQTLHLSSADKFGELTRQVKQHLTINKIKLLSQATENVPQLKLSKDSLNRRTLSVFPNGQVAEYELIYTVRYQLVLSQKDVRSFVFELNRDYQDDPNIALAKSRELELMLSEMRKEAANKILRDLSTIKI
ncbi:MULTISPECIES: LPS assembly lipoprotein LptE [unclassified Colwellia]|jgi:LPS-assembly lipoprotein|uniref:LPS-assembly lipoprotein LptE n=1 Tax=unclassified Colwellia TaxID=196834 RepID=UPI00217520E5|nr:MULTISPECIES: LPS assembly lipoprotein LptE [unclassified Colwellia]